MKDSELGKERIVQPYRLPDMIERLTHPDGWDDEESNLWRDHIYDGQSGKITSRHRFQFYTIANDIIDSEFRTLMHPKSCLRYDGASRLWTTRLLRQDPGDTLARDELLFQLRAPPTEGEQYIPWDEDEMKDMMEHTLESRTLKALINDTVDYELSGPIEVSWSGDSPGLVVLSIKGGTWSMGALLDILPAFQRQTARTCCVYRRHIWLVAA